MEYLFELFGNLPRQGPGDKAATHRAFACLGDMPPGARLLDVGCGNGAQSHDLRGLIDGRIAAVDIYPPFVAQARGERIDGVCASMTALPFARESFDVVWSEGAIYLMGFAEGLRAWRRLLKPGGGMVVSEMSWFTDNAPQEARAFWESAYPAMGKVEDHCAAAQGAGYEVIDTFPLPVKTWWTSLYDPLLEKMPDFRARHAGDAEAQGVAGETEQEIALFRRYSRHYGYQFYVLRKA
ncbi:MAG: class I SAM-dependent methyltransferase [Candidatus Hydrogenedentota bacterium]